MKFRFRKFDKKKVIMNYITLADIRKIKSMGGVLLMIKYLPERK